VVADGDTCSSVAQKRSVTEYGISDLNGLSIDCDPLPVGKTICIPPTCKVHKIGAADDINELAAKYQVTVGQLVAWNPMIRLDGSNLRNLFDRFICIRYVSMTLERLQLALPWQWANHTSVLLVEQ
jgi:spore germination protein YaaH